MCANALDPKARILDRMEQAAPLGAWTPNDFLDLGPREAPGIDAGLPARLAGRDVYASRNGAASTVTSLAHGAAPILPR